MCGSLVQKIDNAEGVAGEERSCKRKLESQLMQESSQNYPQQPVKNEWKVQNVPNESQENQNNREIAFHSVCRKHNLPGCLSREVMLF